MRRFLATVVKKNFKPFTLISSREILSLLNQPQKVIGSQRDSLVSIKPKILSNVQGLKDLNKSLNIKNLLCL